MSKRWAVIVYERRDGAVAPFFHYFDSKDQAEAAFGLLTEKAGVAVIQIDLFEQDLNWKGEAEVSVLLNREERKYA